MTRAPIDPLEACTLSPDPLAERLEWIRVEILAHAVGKTRMPDGIAIELPDVPGIRDRIDHWIELEARCCAGVRFERRTSADPERVRIEVHGIDPHGTLFADVPDLDGPGPGSDAAPSGLGRMLRAGGLGAVVSVFTLCVLPMGLAAVFGGAAISLPLAGLDDPVWIAGGTALAAVSIWSWMGRKRSRCHE